MEQPEVRRLHENMDFLGIRAQATMVGFVKLAQELVRAGVLNEEALNRIKDGIVDELSLGRPHASTSEEFQRTTRQRLDALFAGDHHDPLAGGHVIELVGRVTVRIDQPATGHLELAHELQVPAGGDLVHLPRADEPPHRHGAVVLHDGSDLLDRTDVHGGLRLVKIREVSRTMGPS